MRTRRRTMGIVLAVVLGSVPGIATATPTAPALPRAHWNDPLPRPTFAGSSDGAPRTPASAAPTDQPPPRVLAADGASLYVDGCTGAAGDAYDLRRTALLVESGRAQLTLRTCAGGAALSELDGQELLWATRSIQTGTTHTYRVSRNAGGMWELRYDETPTPVPSDIFINHPASAPGVDELVVQFDEGLLDLPPTCAPSTSVGCLQISLSSFRSGLLTGGDAQDTLPDEDAPTPVWPSACRPDIDPAAAGHVRLTTTSTAGAADLAAELVSAGYRAEAHADAPYVEVLVGATRRVQQALAARPDVIAITPVAPRVTTAVTPDDTRYGDQWYLPRIGMPDAWEARKASGVGIAVVDNGVASDRQELDGRVGVGWDALANEQLAVGTYSDLGGHGTAVSALATAAGNDGHGLAGVDWGATIHPVRVFDHAGCFVSETRYLQALDELADMADAGLVQVANFSLGGSAIPGEAERIAAIVANGAVVVAAMGNNGDRTGVTPSYPAALPEVVAVGATGPDDELAGYSNRGRHVDVVAPGGDQSAKASGDLLTLADPVAVGSGYAPLAGTSFSTPLVSGLAALYLGEHPGATPADVARALVTTAEDLGDPSTIDLAGFDIAYGYGIVDAPHVLAHEPGQVQVRVFGKDRYETAALASRRAFPNPSLVDVVLLATGENYPDALAGGPLAAREHAPLLLTPHGGLHGATIAELDRLDPSRVILLGGPTALSTNVEAQLGQLGYRIERAAGADRYATAATIALGAGDGTWRSWRSSDVVYVATGENFPDALPGGAAAAAFDAPLLLTARTTLPDPTRSALETLAPSEVVLLGGPTAVDQAVVDQITALGIHVDRAAGQSRYETAVAALCPISQLCQADTRFAVVATGEGFADALGGAAAAAALRAPLLLVPRDGELPSVVGQAIDILDVEQAVVLGGSVAVTDRMADQVGALVVR